MSSHVALTRVGNARDWYCDGGHFTFLVLEKLKGKPLDPKVHTIAQYVGLALLLGIVLFVTWQDIANFGFRTMH